MRIRRIFRTLWMICLLVSVTVTPGMAAAPQKKPPRPAADSIPLRLGAVQMAALRAPDAAPQDEFGYAVAISGNTAVVGARNADPQGISAAGAAYVFIRSGADWLLQARLTADTPHAGDSFGLSVAIDGDTVLVGAPGYDDEHTTDSGAAYLFTRSGVTWQQRAMLRPADPADGDAFGVAVALSGDTALIGADSRDLTYLPDVGAAYVFIRSGKEWAQQALLLPPEVEMGAQFGAAVALDGRRALVGAPQTNPYAAADTGAAYLFERSAQQWLLRSTLRAKDAHPADAFGAAVALDGMTALVGAPFHDPKTEKGRLSNAGAAYLFEPRAGDWAQRAILLPEDQTSFDNFGTAVALSAGRALVGARGKDRAGYTAAGAAYLFRRTGPAWQEQTRILADFAYKNDAFGYAVALAGDYALIGATGRDPGLLGQAGEAFAYHLEQVHLPATGFAPGRVSVLPHPPALPYRAMGDLWLEIPALGTRSRIVGVPNGGEGWDVDWLWEDLGYLQGTAFPTLPGNTALVGHVYLPNGLPGPFASLKQLAWGDRLLLHAWGQTYTYEVRRVRHVSPDALEVLAHEDADWLTLITCEGYDARTGTYRLRTVVQAVLVARSE